MWTPADGVQFRVQCVLWLLGIELTIVCHLSKVTHCRAVLVVLPNTGTSCRHQFPIQKLQNSVSKGRINLSIANTSTKQVPYAFTPIGDRVHYSRSDKENENVRV